MRKAKCRPDFPQLPDSTAFDYFFYLFELIMINEAVIFHHGKIADFCKRHKLLSLPAADSKGLFHQHVLAVFKGTLSPGIMQ